MIGSEPLANIVPAATLDGRRRYRGDAVRHERRVEDRTAEDRSPRAVQPHGHRGSRRDGARTSRASTSTSISIPLDDAKTYELLCKADTPRHLPAGGHVRQADPHRHAARDCLADHGRRGCAEPTGSDRGWRHRDVDAAQARRGAGDLHAPGARADPQGDVRCDPLPGPGDEDRVSRRRLLAR